MNYKEIEKALNDRGYTWTSASKVIGKSVTSICRVAKRDLDSKNIAKSLAVLIDSDVETVFPDKPEYQEKTRQETQSDLIEKGRQKLIDAGLAEAI
jgi:hypothetical protein